MPTLTETTRPRRERQGTGPCLTRDIEGGLPLVDAAVCVHLADVLSLVLDGRVADEQRDVHVLIIPGRFGKRVAWPRKNLPFVEHQ